MGEEEKIDKSLFGCVRGRERSALERQDVRWRGKSTNKNYNEHNVRFISFFSVTWGQKNSESFPRSSFPRVRVRVRVLTQTQYEG